MNVSNNISSVSATSIASYQDFWQWFLLHQQHFYDQYQQTKVLDETLMDEISSQLQTLNNGFFCQLGVHDEHTLEFIVTVDSDVKKIVYVEELIAAAPTVQGWKFTALKPPFNADTLVIEAEGLTFTCENLTFFANETEDCPDEIDLTFVYEDLNDSNQLPVENGIYLFLESYLGESTLVNTLDTIRMISKAEALAAHKTLVPMHKLPAFLVWRQTEFVECYEASYVPPPEEEHGVFEATLPNGNRVVANACLTLLDWDAKASHPWVVIVSTQYNGTANKGLPSEDEYQTFQLIEDTVLDAVLPTGTLPIGREFGDNLFDIFLVSKDFRGISKKLDQLKLQNPDLYTFEVYLYRDKYWKTYKRFSRH